MSIRKEQPGRCSRYMLSWGQLSVALQHNDRVSMGWCNLGLGAVNSFVFSQCCSASSGASDTAFVQLRAASSGTSFAWCLSLQLSWTIPIPCLAQSPLRLGIIHGPMIDRSLSWLSVRYFSAPALPSHRQNILQARAADTVPSAYSLRHPDTDLLSKYTPAS